MERNKRTAKINFNRNGQGFLSPKLTLPVPFVESLGLTEDNREVVIEYDKKANKIIISKEEK